MIVGFARKGIERKSRASVSYFSGFYHRDTEEYTQRNHEFNLMIVGFARKGIERKSCGSVRPQLTPCKNEIISIEQSSIAIDNAFDSSFHQRHIEIK
jgi:hypothetical protein